MIIPSLLPSSVIPGKIFIRFFQFPNIHDRGVILGSIVVSCCKHCRILLSTITWSNLGLFVVVAHSAIHSFYDPLACLFTNQLLQFNPHLSLCTHDLNDLLRSVLLLTLFATSSEISSHRVNIFSFTLGILSSLNPVRRCHHMQLPCWFVHSTEMLLYLVKLMISILRPVVCPMSHLFKERLAVSIPFCMLVLLLCNSLAMNEPSLSFFILLATEDSLVSHFLCFWYEFIN